VKSSKHYLIKALYEWIADNDCTPYLLVNADIDGVLVPRQHVKDGRIVLNIAAFAIKNLHINHQSISFDARFSGRSTYIEIPVVAVISIYAYENGQGMIFDPSEEFDPPAPIKPSGRATLRVIK